ncbi:MAG: GHKL domain-containing protein [Bacteroidales bacterium]|nr:GHKL domain-containing protein [Bacteroidales bacterium]
MGLNSYRIGLIIRIVGLLIVMLTFSFLVTQSNWFFSSIIIGLTLIILVIEFFRYSFRYKNDIENLIQSFEENNYQSNIRVTKHRSKYKEVEKAFERIQNVVQKVRLEREVQFNFLKILIENVPSGIITLNSENKILNVNQSAKTILSISDSFQWSTLENRYPLFANQIKSNNPVNNELINLNESKDTIQLSYSISTIKLQNDLIKIISFQNIKTVLDQSEMQAWNNLIRTMTHEIMNSVTPIISLAESGLQILSNDRNSENPLKFTEKNLDHLNKSFSSIYNKSLWLKEFVENYRKLIRIPQPTLKDINLADIINSCVQNFSEIFKKENIEVKNNLNNVIANIDPNLIEQVINNILKNSIDALKKRSNKRIEIIIEENNNRPLIKFIDNGEGIKPENCSKIFIPFFTTKETGSGIGLSLSRQIMRLHEGTLTFESNPGVKTVFTLQFA